MGVSLELSRVLRDARYPQIVVLSVLVAYGCLYLDFILPIAAIPVTIGTAFLLEHLCFRWRRAEDRPRPPYESALISALSTLVLFRSTQIWPYAAVVCVAVLSKLIRVNGRHFINPTNGAVIFGLSFLPGWVTSGQWGYDVLLIFCLVSVGWIVLIRAGRIDSALAFLLGYVLAQVIRIEVFGFQWPVLLHQFESGALWVFALFMITDPRTTPLSRGHRIIHGVLVACLATYLLQFYFVRDSFLWSLLVLAPTVPLFNRWSTVAPKPVQSTGGLHAPPIRARAY